MLDWIKDNVIVILATTVAALAVSAAFLFTMWRGAEHEADELRDLARMQSQVIEAQTRISEHEDHTNRITERVIERVMESPNANAPVPSDLADAWLDGIDSLRDDSGKPDERHEELSGPPSADARKGRSDARRIDRDLAKAGSSLSEL